MDIKGFSEAFHGFVKAYSEKLEAHDKAAFPSLPPRMVGVDEGNKYMKVWVSSHGNSRSVYCFVNRENGDVLKAASWKAPAKGKRSNIFDADFGLSGMGPYGAMYYNGGNCGWAA